MQTAWLHRAARMQAMKNQPSNPIKIFLIFSLGSAVYGALFVFHILFIKGGQTESGSMDVINGILFSIAMGSYLGIILYLPPSAMLGIIFAKIKPKRTMKMYIFIALFSPVLLMIYEYIVICLTCDKIDFFKITVMNNPVQIISKSILYSMSSIIVARLALPKF